MYYYSMYLFINLLTAILNIFFILQQQEINNFISLVFFK